MYCLMEINEWMNVLYLFFQIFFLKFFSKLFLLGRDAIIFLDKGVMKKLGAFWVSHTIVFNEIT